MIDHIVELVEEKAAELNAARAALEAAPPALEPAE